MSLASLLLTTASAPQHALMHGSRKGVADHECLACGKVLAKLAMQRRGLSLKRAQLFAQQSATNVRQEAEATPCCCAPHKKWPVYWGVHGVKEAQSQAIAALAIGADNGESRAKLACSKCCE